MIEAVLGDLGLIPHGSEGMMPLNVQMDLPRDKWDLHEIGCKYFVWNQITSDSFT